jgi:hypothetical protein
MNRALNAASSPDVQLGQRSLDAQPNSDKGGRYAINRSEGPESRTGPPSPGEMIDELVAAGWRKPAKKINSGAIQWKSPTGGYYPGLVAAWKAMKAALQHQEET